MGLPQQRHNQLKAQRGALRAHLRPQLPNQLWCEFFRESNGGEPPTLTIRMGLLLLQHRHHDLKEQLFVHHH